MRKFLVPLLALCGLLSATAQELPTVVIGTQGIVGPVGASMSHLIDPGATMTADEIGDSPGFVQCASSVPLFALSKDAHWLKFKVTNTTEQPDLVLSIPYSGIDELDLYLRDGQHFRSIGRSGLSRDRHEGETVRREFIFELPIASKASGEVLL
jgi:hypothetical protein